MMSDTTTPIEQQPLTLVWPTDFKVYTQKFGQRPEFYGKFGLPGHEGVDIRAPTGSNVYACADGVVSEVGWRRPGHPYGYAVRIRHKRIDGEYETIYAHLSDGSARVKVGETVAAGQLIALADSTGNSSAAHLHLSLKKIGTKNGGYKDIINPEPYFVTPARVAVDKALWEAILATADEACRLNGQLRSAMFPVSAYLDLSREPNRRLRELLTKAGVTPQGAKP